MRKSIKMLLYFALLFSSLSSHAIIYNKDPEARAKMLKVMDAFCAEAGGVVTTFEDSCANSCVLFDRQTGDAIPEMKEQCKPQQTISCQCPVKQCLKDRKCQLIIIK